MEKLAELLQYNQNHTTKYILSEMGVINNKLASSLACYMYPVRW